MNYTLLSQQISNPESTIFVYQPQESLTTWGIFLSSLILSTTALITQIMAQIQKSKCTNINCLGSNCVRNVSV
jgi:hypothetical protein